MEATLILAPAAVLVLWTLVVLFWMVITRFAAFRHAGVQLKDAEAGGRYTDIENKMPAKINWPSHNYTHLVEQPTIFYAVVVILAVAGSFSIVSVVLAWAYAVLRIVHSLWQIFVNTIPMRARLFGLSTLCLIGLAVDGVRVTVF